MGGAGDHSSIGPLTLWDSKFLQTGDPRVANAVEVNALDILSFNVSYRDTITNMVPTADEISWRLQHPQWFPTTGNANEQLTWEVAHQPAE